MCVCAPPLSLSLSLSLSPSLFSLFLSLELPFCFLCLLCLSCSFYLSSLNSLSLYAFLYLSSSSLFCTLSLFFLCSHLSVSLSLSSPVSLPAFSLFLPPSLSLFVTPLLFVSDSNWCSANPWEGQSTSICQMCTQLGHLSHSEQGEGQVFRAFHSRLAVLYCRRLREQQRRRRLWQRELDARVTSAPTASRSPTPAHAQSRSGCALRTTPSTSETTDSCRQQVNNRFCPWFFLFIFWRGPLLRADVNLSVMRLRSYHAFAVLLRLRVFALKNTPWCFGKNRCNLNSSTGTWK